MSDLIRRKDAVDAVHKYFIAEIDKTPHEIDEDGDDVYTDMPTVNSLLACNKELSKAIKALPSAEAVHESCEDCPLYDHEKHSCPRFNKVIPRVLEERRAEDIQDAMAIRNTILVKEYLRGRRDAVHGWIPCSERLPNEKQEVYVTVYFTEGDTGRAYGCIDGFGKWHLYSIVEGTLNSGYEVIAWMPLPEPYKGGDNE